MHIVTCMCDVGCSRSLAVSDSHWAQWQDSVDAVVRGTVSLGPVLVVGSHHGIEYLGEMDADLLEATEDYFLVRSRYVVPAYRRGPEPPKIGTDPSYRRDMPYLDAAILSGVSAVSRTPSMMKSIRMRRCHPFGNVAWSTWND